MRKFRHMDKGILTDSDMKQLKYRLLYLTMFCILILACAIMIIPVLWMLLSGFKSADEIYAVPTSFFPKEFRISKIIDFWNETKFYRYYANTFIMAGGAALADMLISGMAGYVLSRLKPRGSRIIFVLCFWIMLLPGTMRTVPLYMSFKDVPIIHINLLDSYIPIWIMAAANAFNIILFKNFFDGISISLLEAAKIDGASDIEIFLKIIVPLSVPVFLVVGLFTFNGSLGQYFWPYILISNTRLEVLGVKIFKLKNESYTMDYQMLALVFSIVPQVIIFAVFQKQIMGGINIGGVKG